MELKRCERGHFYDAEANSTCPQCAAEDAAGGAGIGATAPVGRTGSFEDPGPTTPVGATGGLGETKPASQPWQIQGEQVDVYDDVTTPVGIENGPAGFSPVVGWLVSIDGPSKGSDYRIRAGYNYIGRDDYMDICVKGDNKISREKHAVIAYDPEEHVFFFGPADGKSLVRVNDKLVMNAQEIKTHDVLKIGSTKLIFVPLCGEKFDW